MLGGVDFKHLYLNLGDKAFETMETAEKAGAPLVKYGMFINTGHIAARDAVAQVLTVPLMILGWGVFIALLVASIN